MIDELAKASSHRIRHTWEKRSSPDLKYQIQKKKTAACSYVMVLLSQTLLWGQGAGKPPSNHDMVEWKVGGSRFILRLAGTCRSMRCLQLGP